MGTTLTGTTPQDTYDSLIKVTDNGPLSGTAKYLSDGLGNDSALALSTGNIGVGTTSPAAKFDARISGTSSGAVITVGNTGSGYFGGLAVSDGGAYPVQLYGAAISLLTGNVDYASATEKVRITSAGNVGIGTSSPTSILHIAQNGTDDSNATFGQLRISGTSDLTKVLNLGYNSTSEYGFLQVADISNAFQDMAYGAANHIFKIGSTERIRVTSDGLTFNGDTAAANALDDYEEGTFTPTFSGVTYSGATSNLGRYTKIGRLVHFDIFIYDAVFSSSSGPARIGGLPFTANPQVYGQGLITYNTAVDGNTNGGYVDAGGTSFYPVDENSTAVASFINGTVSLMVSGSYTV